MAARQHRFRQPLFSLGQEDDYRSGRRLLQRLEKGIRRFRPQGVGPIDDCDAATAGIRSEGKDALETADLTNAQVAAVGMVAVFRLVTEATRLDHLDVGMTAGHGVATGPAFAARLVTRSLAVERGGELERHAAFANTLGATEQIGVSRPFIP